MGWIGQFLITLLVSVIAEVVVIFLGIKSIKDYFTQLEFKREIGELKSFWGGSRSEIYYILFGIEKAQREEEIEPRFGYSEAYGIAEITRVLETIHGKNVIINLVPLEEDAKFDSKFFEENIIIMGGEGSLKRFGMFCREICVPYYTYHFDPRDRRVQRIREGRIIEEIASVARLDEGKLVSDIGTVVRIVNPNKRTLIILFNGNYAAGLLGAISATTSKEFFPAAKFNKQSMAQQLVVEVPYVESIITRSHSVFVIRDWFQFDVNTDKLRNAIGSTLR